MKYALAMAVLLAGLPSLIGAQPHSASHSFASAPRMASGFASHSAPAPSRAAITRRAPSSSWRRGGGATRRLFPNVFPGASCLTNPSYAGSYFCRQFYPRGGLSYGYGVTWGMPYYWDYPSDSQAVDQPAAAAPEQDDALASQVEHLTNEVESLRDEQASRSDVRPRVAAPLAAAQEKPAATILVYRDGRRTQVQNYAILGHTLWIFADQTSRRVSLAELDLPTTKKLNEERGVDFLPSDSH